MIDNKAACLDENHIEIPEGAVAILHLKGARGSYVAVSVDTFENFSEHGANYVAKMVEAINEDARAECYLCDRVFEAHEKDDVSAPEQRKLHWRGEHRERYVRST